MRNKLTMKQWAVILVVISLLSIALGEIIESADLDIKVDTIGVDTVGFHKVKFVGPEYRSSGDPLFINPDSIWVPVLHYTTDTTYRLTEEQRGWLELQIKMQKKWKDLIPKGGIVDSAIVFMGLVDSVDRPADYDPLKDTNYFYISDAIIDWPYSDTISIDTAVTTYIDAVLNARIDSLVKVIEGMWGSGHSGRYNTFHIVTTPHPEQ